MSKADNLAAETAKRLKSVLSGHDFDPSPYLENMPPRDEIFDDFCICGVTPVHRSDLRLSNCCLSGSYFLGRCIADDSVIYRSDVRGDELKKKGDWANHGGEMRPLAGYEYFRIKDSFLIYALVHNNSHDPDSPGEFLIRNTAAMHYANIHGAPVDGVFLGPFATVDITTTAKNCIIGKYSYVQAGRISNMSIEPGLVWLKTPDFEFKYLFDKDVLTKYVRVRPGKEPRGIFVDFMNRAAPGIKGLYRVPPVVLSRDLPGGASINPFSVVSGNSWLEENVLVSQCAYVRDSFMGKGANAQENSFIINSKLAGENVTAHGAKIINADLDEYVFVGFNSFLRGRPNARLMVDEGCIIMPHTIIDIKKSLHIPAGRMVWGYVTGPEDLEQCSISLEDLVKIKGKTVKGRMTFSGDGEALVKGFSDRIRHILEENGAFFDGTENAGHAQESKDVSINILRPFMGGDRKGLYPNIEIKF